MRRYLDYGNVSFTPQPAADRDARTCKLSSLTANSVVENYTKLLIKNLKKRFSINNFHAIVAELEALNRFKVEQISEQLKENNHLIDEIRLLVNSKITTKEEQEPNKDDMIVHLGSTLAQIVPRPIDVNYKPVHMVYLREALLIKNDHDQRLPLKSITNGFVPDLINTKPINVTDEVTGRSCDIETKWLYFAKLSDSNIILPLKLRFVVFDAEIGRRRYDFIGEESGKNNDYHCLVFFMDVSKNIAASYHPSAHLHICLGQIHSTHAHECQNDFLERYFASYPEGMMLRAKEGITVKVRNIFFNATPSQTTFIPALVIQIDGSIMQIELSHNKQRIWLYRGSPLLDHMQNYYSTQNKPTLDGFTRHTAQQHLSTRRSNASEMICLNDQANRNKSVRAAEQAIDGNDEPSEWIGSSSIEFPLEPRKTRSRISGTSTCFEWARTTKEFATGTDTALGHRFANTPTTATQQSFIHGTAVILEHEWTSSINESCSCNISSLRPSPVPVRYSCVPAM